MLENIDLKMYEFSPLAIFDMWENEKITIFNSIIKEIKNRRPIKLYDKYFTGGGSTDFKEYIRKINCEILDNNLFTNVNGNLIIAEEKWRRE